MKSSSYPTVMMMSFCIFYLSMSCKENDSGPIASFTFQNDRCIAPCTITFNNTSQHANSYQWDFGDGNFSTDQNPSHEYIESGEYNVNLTAIGPGGDANHSLKVSISSDPVVINGIFPNSNPVGGPVLIEGEGFTDKTDVYFNNIKATIEERSDAYLTTKVPAGLGATTVTLRIENGIMFDEESFDVLSAFPSDLPSSPPNIIIPSGLTSPISYTISQINKIIVMNVYDASHIIDLVVNVDEELEGEVVSEEILTINGTRYISPTTFDEDPYFDFDFDPDNSEVLVSSIEINRSDSDPTSHPYPDDVLFGSFSTIEDFPLPVDLIESIPEFSSFTENFLLLTSSITGRQYLFVVICDGDTRGDCL